MDDIDHVVAHMRKEDVEECAAGGHTPFGALAMSISASIVCKAILAPDTGKPGAIMGVCPGNVPSWGAIWLLGTDDIKRHRVIFLRRSKETLADLYTESGKEVFYNYSYVQNHVHHAWLRWLGFTFIRKVPFPPHGQLFWEFVKIKG
jgi:hypothetical protein